MAQVRLVSPKVIVQREGQDPLEIQTANPDLIRWDRTRIKHKWPAFEEAPFLWLTFISWCAARRTGVIPPDLTYEVWEASVVDVAPAPEEDDELARPTPLGLVSD